MTNLAVRDADNLVRYLAMAGAGDNGDPFVPRQAMSEVLPASFSHAQVTIATAGQVVQLPTFALTRGVLIKALSTNNGSVYIGGATVSSSTGFELDKSEAILIRIDQLNKLYITTTANGEGICLFGV